MITPTGRVLIFDDSMIDSQILCNLLRDMADVTIANRPEEARSFLASETFDVILLDVMMQGDEAGFVMCRDIRASMPRHNDTPVVFVTSLDDPESEVRGLNLGALDFITKPFAPAVVRARVGNYIALAQAQRRLKEANAQLQRLSTRDDLTDLSNRRHFQETAEMNMTRADRSDQPMSILLLDLDHFKQVNDTLGHAAGDSVLRAMAKTWHKELRQHDLLARIGGEEFAIMLPDCTASQAETLAHRLLAATRRSRPLEAEGNDLHVTVSIGVATRQPSAGTDLSTLLMSADNALYAAKHQGRNRAIVAPEPARPQPISAPPPAKTSKPALRMV